MTIKALLLAAIMAFVQSVNAESNNYDTGVKLAACAGKSKYISFILQDNKSYTDAKYHSLKEKRYELAAAYSFNKHGMNINSSKEHSSEIMNEEYIALAIQYSDFISRPIGKDPFIRRNNNNDSYRLDKLNKIFDSSSVSHKDCAALKDTVKSYVKEYRMNY